MAVAKPAAIRKPKKTVKAALAKVGAHAGNGDYMSIAEIKEKREKYLLPAVMTYYENPVHVVKGDMQYVYDHNGKKYLDGFAAVVTVSVGHCHPEVVDAVEKQNRTLQHMTTLYYTESVVKLAEKLASIMPKGLSKSFFTNSGTEANEIAAMLVKNYTGRHEMLGLRHSFHGRTLMSMTLTGQSIWRHSTPYVYGVNHVSPAYCYRCPFDLKYPSCGIACAKDIENTIRFSTSGKIGGLIAEPIQGFGGVVTPPKEYFPMVYDIVKKYGGLFIADEVQTGFGRTGDKWWGIEQYGVKPDIITMAKGMGNGIPIGGLTTTPEVAESMRGITHFSTYGGNPVSTTQGLEVIKVMQKYDMPKNCRVLGDYLMKNFKEFEKKHKIVGEARGMGLMLGIELVRDKKTKEPASKEMLKAMEMCKDRGLLIGKGGMLANVVRIKPPMCVNKGDAEFIVKTLDEVFGHLSKTL